MSNNNGDRRAEVIDEAIRHTLRQAARAQDEDENVKYTLKEKIGVTLIWLLCFVSGALTIYALVQWAFAMGWLR